MKKRLIVILHNLRSAYNVGSIFRTADAIGASAIYLTGHTPAPGKDKIYQTAAEKMIAKTALGAEKDMAFIKIKSIQKVIDGLRSEKYTIVALEQARDSVDYRKFKPIFPLALIVGNEPKGIGAKILEKCDRTIEIPMRGKKESLNVAVAFGIAGYEVTRKW